VDGDGDLIVVGAPFANDQIGAAYIFQRSGTTWNETMTLTPIGDAANGVFGYAVDVEGDAIVDCAPYAPYMDSITGAAYVFALNATTNVWVQTESIQASDGANNDQFGYSVALSGGSVVVEAPFANSFNGTAYVYDGLAFEETKLLEGNATACDFFGWSVAIFEDTVVVGALRHDRACHIFKRSRKDDSWSQATKLTSSENNS
jgi:hypothetical protein